MTVHLYCTNSWSKLVLAAIPPTLLCPGLFSLWVHSRWESHRTPALLVRNRGWVWRQWDTVQGVQRRQCNNGVQWISGLLRTSPLFHFPSQRRPLSKILSPAFTVQADETFKPRVEWSEMFQSYIERHQGGLPPPPLPPTVKQQVVIINLEEK